MTLAATGTCDGCEREGPVQQLQRVLLPSGNTAVCCPECRYHAERLAERTTGTCQGCDRDVTVADLGIAELPDGREIQLCPDCRAEADGLDVDGVGRPSAGRRRHRPASDGDGPHPDSSTTRRSEHPNASGNGSTPGSSYGSGSRATTGAGTASTNGGVSATTNEGVNTDTNGGGTARTNGGSTGRASDAATDGTAEATADSGTSGRPARTRNTCDQCGGEFSTELYRVTTIDDRTEELCADCKDDCVDQGIVTDVELRRAQAFEVLGITGNADDEEIRQAYVERVKEAHPDSEDGNRSEFMLVKEAYDRLSAE